jgi:phage terminase large subunit-like protein
VILTVPSDDAVLFPTLGPQVCDWIEAELCFGPGDLRGSPAVIDDEKRALIYRMYEVFPQAHPNAGRRRFKRAALSMAKGTAKTEFAAWLAACELHPRAPVRCIGWKRGKPIGGPVTDPFVILVAYTEEQSDELAYGALKAILEESAIGKDFDIGLERIMRKDGAGKAVSLSSSPNARDGARTTWQCFDETHRHTLPRLKQAHQTMMANLPKRKLADAWALEITTAPEPGSGSIAESTMEYAQAIADGLTSDAALFFFHRQASDVHDLTTREGARAAVIEASGPSAAWRDIDAIVSMWNDPTTDRTYWERVYCNRLVKGSTQAFNVETWKALTKQGYRPKPGALITVGFDGAQFHDSTGIVCTEVETGFQWKEGVWECPPGGDKLDPPWKVPAPEVDLRMRAIFEQFTVWRLYADPPYWQSWIASWAGAFDGDGDQEKRVIEWWTNRRRQMTSALEAFTTAISEGTISHDGDKDVTRHLGNARKQELSQRDEQGKALYLIRKERPDSPQKIDLAMAATLSWEARMDAIASGALTDVESEASRDFEERGLFVT